MIANINTGRTKFNHSKHSKFREIDVVLKSVKVDNIPAKICLFRVNCSNMFKVNNKNTRATSDLDKLYLQ